MALLLIWVSILVMWCVPSLRVSETALVRCLGREISFSILKIAFSVLIPLSPSFCKVVSLCFRHFCMISHSSALMKNKGRVHKCSYVDLILFKRQNTIKNGDFCTVNLDSATFLVSLVGM